MSAEQSATPSSAPADTASPPRKRHRVRNTFITLGVVIIVLIGAVFGLLLFFNIPQNGAAMAAKSVCSAAFVAGRSPDNLMAEDVLPASAALKAVSVDVDTTNNSVTGRFLGMFPQTAALHPDRGCVLFTEPDSSSEAYQVTAKPGPWPQGDTPTSPENWAADVERQKLESTVEQAFVGAGDPQLTNARGVAVVQGDELLVLREAPGFENVPLHGWSMTKSVAGMMAYKLISESGLSPDTKVVDAFPSDRQPEWVNEWRTDERANITIADLAFMRDGLKNSEDYNPWGSVPQMLYGEPNMAAWAADHPAEVPAGTRWQYLSATSNILADVSRGQLPNDEAYWEYPYKELFDVIGATSATLESDTSGTWVGSSYLWATTADWARFGQLMRDRGSWLGTPVIPEEWAVLAQTPAMPDGEGHGYGWQTWLLGDPVGGECAGTAGLPTDVVAMEGHWGQIVASSASKDAVVVRLGWTFNKDQFDECAFLGDVFSALPDRT